MFDWFHKTLPKNTFYVLLEMTLHLEKKYVIPIPVCLTLLLQKMWLIKSGLGGKYKNLHLIIWEGVLINGNRANGL